VHLKPVAWGFEKKQFLLKGSKIKHFAA
jgi:hypothetical protein